jgi:hypothetical protein
VLVIVDLFWTSLILNIMMRGSLVRSRKKMIESFTFE